MIVKTLQRFLLRLFLVKIGSTLIGSKLIASNLSADIYDKITGLFDLAHYLAVLGLINSKIPLISRH